MVPSTNIEPVLLFDSPFLTVLVDITLKATVLLVVAYLANLALARASAAFRHRVWVTAFGGILILPVFAVCLPAWRLPVFGEVSVMDRLESDVEGRGGRRLDGSQRAAGTDRDTPGTGSTRGDISARLIAEGMQQDVEVESLQRGNVTERMYVLSRSVMGRWPSSVAVLWVAGVILGLAPLMLGVAKHRRIKRESTPLDGTEWCELLGRLMAQVNLGRKVDVLQSDRVSVPMIFGLRRACILLPPESCQWSVQIKRQVLLHELAHVRRWDVVLHVFARVACSFYWFHPLAWHALRQLRLEREGACDDWVLRMGESPSSYATNLLEIARASRHHRLRLATDMSMATSTQLEGRLLSILDSNRSREEINHTYSGVLLAVAALLSVTVAVPSVWGQRRTLVAEGEPHGNTLTTKSVPEEPSALNRTAGVPAEKEDELDGYPEEQKRAIAEVRRLGGKFTTDGTKPTKPVIAVYLSDGKASDDTLEYLSGLTYLRTLTLSRTNVSDEGLRHLSRMKRLKYLYLEGTQVHGAGFANLADLDNLIELNVDGTSVNDDCLRHIMRLNNLRVLGLQKTPVTVAGVRELWRVSPNLRIGGLETLAAGDAKEALRLLRDAAEEAKVERSRLAQAKVSPEAKVVFDALRARDQQVMSFRFEWKQNHVEHKGSVRYLDFDTGRVTPVTVVEDVNYTWQVNLAVAGRRMAYSFSGLRPERDGHGNQYDADGNTRLASQSYQSRFDGRTERSLFQYPNQNKQSQGYEGPSAKSGNASVIHVSPLLWTYSTFDPSMANVDWQNLNVEKNRASIDGRECVAVRQDFDIPHPDAKSPPRAFWWLDPKRDYSIVRHVYVTIEDKPDMQVDISSTKDSKYGWVPTRWTIRRFQPDGKVWSTVTATVTEYDINPSLDEKAFRLDFPAGTHIN